jgi:phosphatidylglycerophosphate synthase
MTWRAEYKSLLKMRKLEEIPDLILYRPAAFLVVKAVSGTKIRPDQISITAILMGFVAGYFYSLGKTRESVVAGLFYLLFNILDCSDGMLARLKKTGTLVGRIIDGISDYFASVAVYTGLLIGFALKTDRAFYWSTLLIIAAICSGIHSILVDFYRNRFVDYVTLGRSNFRNDIGKYRKEYISLRKQKGEKFKKLILLLYLKYSQLQSSLATEKKKVQLIATPAEYYEKNKKIIRFWVLLGPSMQITVLVVCSFFYRIDIFIWTILFIFNFLAVILWIIQSLIDSTFKKTTSE